MVRRDFLVGQPTDPKEVYARIRRFVGIDLAKRFFRQDSPKTRRKIAAIARFGLPDAFFFWVRPCDAETDSRAAGKCSSCEETVA